MRRIITLLFLLIAGTAAGQYNPAHKNYGNYNVYGSQWINGDLKLQRCTRSASDTLLIFARSTGELDTVNWSTLRSGITAGNTHYWDSTSSVLHPTDTANAVAIGTNAVASGTMLRVNNGSVLFDGSTGTTPASGKGTRLMWIPSKAAFRAGVVSGTQWDDATIGVNSVAFGNNSYAPGASSFAGGRGKAYGEYSFAWGDSTKVTGYHSIGIGFSNLSVSQGSISIGYDNYAGGRGSVAMGMNSYASSYYASMAIGVYCQANDNGAYAGGYYSEAFKTYSFSSGYRCKTRGVSSVAMGDSSYAVGASSFAANRGKTYGKFSVAFGDSTNAQSAYSSVFGYGNVLQGNKTTWVSTDDLFVIGNGYTAKNNALTILKNGTAYIGDASSTTDPILTVSTTDSTTSIIGTVSATSLASGSSDITVVEVDSTGVLDTIGTINIATDTISHLYTRMTSTDTIISSSGAIQINYKFTLADDDSLSIPTGSGFGQIKVDSVGVKKAAIYNFTYDNTGTPDLVSKTANVAASNTDANFCAYKGVGAYVTFRNRLGYSVDCLMTILCYE